MKASIIRQKLKPWMLPIAMVCGVLFHSQIEYVAPIVPYLIFSMLLITFCRVKPREFNISRVLWELLAIQLVGSVALFWTLRPLGLDIAEAAFICVFCPTATAAPVVTGMLGGSIPKVAAYSVISNLAVALLAPLLFTWMGENQTDMTFIQEFTEIAARVAPLIVFPLLVAFLLYFFAPKVHGMISGVQSLSFYLWAVSLIVVVGRSVSFMLAEPHEKIPEMIAMALIAGIVCILQFIIGRKLGQKHGDKISAAQSLGQKNTVLAIWMALTYLNPIASVGPAAYVAWQNTINSAQLYLKMRKVGK